MKYRISLIFLCILAFLALFADFFASENPIYISYKGKNYYPLFTNEKIFDSLPNPRNGKIIWQRVADADWKNIPTQKSIWTLAPFSTKYTGKKKLQPPFSCENIVNQQDNLHFTHYLGTDLQDIDVFASLIQGAKTSLSVGLGSLLLISFLGISLGGAAGYFGDNKLFLTRGQQYGLVIGFFIGIFYGFYLIRYQIFTAFEMGKTSVGILYLLGRLGILILSILFFAFVGKKMSFIPFLKEKKNLPLDSLITQLTDIQMALPTILIIMALSLMLPKSILSLILIIGCAGYMGVARLARSLSLQIRNLPYIEAAEALGISQFRIVWRHILPNIFPPIAAILLLTMGDMILLETTFSFLNIGIPAETVSWGKILNQARTSPESWWLSVFPTLIIAATAGSFKVLGKKISQ